MPRATTKADLIKSANEQFDSMWKLIDAMSEDELHAVFDFGADWGKKEAHWKRDKNIRDVLVHLYEWHQLLLNWVAANEKGEVKPFIPLPYTFKTYSDMNVMLCEKHQATPYEAKKMLLDSHKKVLALIERFSNEELFTNKHFSWTGSTSLGSYCVSTTASHYDWAIKKIKQHRKSYKVLAGENGG